jgi:hypothetical protein
MASPHQELMNRLVRVESKLVRGFEELGVNIDGDNDWLTVDDASRVVYVATLGRSMQVMLTDMVRKGAKHVGKEYDVVHKGNVVATITFNPTT